jgi:hypothetical protein
MRLLSISGTTEKRSLSHRAIALWPKMLFSYKQQNALEMPLLLRRATTEVAAAATGARVSSLTVAEAAIQRRELKTKGSGTDASCNAQQHKCRCKVAALYPQVPEIARFFPVHHRQSLPAATAWDREKPKNSR